MNKILIGLLIIVAGAAAYFYFSKKDPKPGTVKRDNNAIIGTWTVPGDSLEPVIRDQSLIFTKAGELIHRQDSTFDTTYYSWTKDGNLAIARSKEDSIKRNVEVLKLERDTLQIRGEDSVTILFLKKTDKE